MRVVRKVPQTEKGASKVPPAQKSAPVWHAWPAHQLWLWSDPTHPDVRARIGAALANAVRELAARDIERIAEYAERGDPGSALRLTARLLRTGGSDQKRARDLASCALLLAILEHRDERAAVELTVLVSLRAVRAATRWSDQPSYPAPLDRPHRLRARLTQRGRLAVAVLAQQSGGWARAVTDLGRLAAGDPLSDVGTSGRHVSGWEGR